MTASFYESQAARFIEIDGEGSELVCTIPSEKDVNVRYTLECKEFNTHVEVLSCSCRGYQYHGGHCKHVDLTQSMWNRIYKTNIEKASKQQETSPSIASTTPASYTMPSALLAKLASLNEEETARAAKINAEVDAVAAETALNDTAEHLEEVYQELRETKTLKVGIAGSAALAMNRRDTSVLNSAQQQASKLMELPSRQRKQQDLAKVS